MVLERFEIYEPKNGSHTGYPASSYVVIGSGEVKQVDALKLAPFDVLVHRMHRWSMKLADVSGCLELWNPVSVTFIATPCDSRSPAISLLHDLKLNVGIPMLKGWHRTILMIFPR